MIVKSNRINKPSRIAVLAGIPAVLILVVAASFSSRIRAQGGEVDGVPVPNPILRSNELLAEAQPDDCFNGIGVDYPPMNPDGTCDVGQPKTNESYIWGMTEQSGKLYFGSMANAACIVSGQTSLAEDGIMGGGEINGPRNLVCEYGESQFAREHPLLPDGIGDWRAPSIYQYDLATDELKRMNIRDSLLKRTLGIRGAGSIDNIAFLAGSNVFTHSIDIFAFKADTGDYLGSCENSAYTYARKWQVADGVLYVGVGSQTNGAVLRWNGTIDSFAGNFCDDFQEVGRIPTWTASMTVYTGGDGQDRIAVNTVPIKNSIGVGVYISPPLGPDGLDPSDADSWVNVWNPGMYEPDHIVRQFGYSGGAIQSFDGWVYWGTIHLPHSAPFKVHQNCAQNFCFGVPANQQELDALEDGVFRTTSIWRGRNLEDSATREIQLLYGESELPACHSPHSFELTSTGWTPLYGHSGFDNPSNLYTWQMDEFDGHLFIGTFDAVYGPPQTGADLWRFDNSNSPAVNENFRGLGDTNNYGIRAMVGLSDGSALMLGMANPSNLDIGGGWELRRLKERPAP